MREDSEFLGFDEICEKVSDGESQNSAQIYGSESFVVLVDSKKLMREDLSKRSTAILLYGFVLC